MDNPIPASPQLFGVNISSGIRGLTPTKRVELPENSKTVFRHYYSQIRDLDDVLAARVASYLTLVKLELKVVVDSLVHRLSGLPNLDWVTVIPNNRLLQKQITPNLFLEKADRISKQWQNPKIYVKENTWYIGDFVLHITDEGAFYEDIGGTCRRFNNLAVATHDFYRAGLDVDEIVLLDSISSLYCWLSIYLPQASHSGARILDLAEFILKIPADGREDIVSYPQEEMASYSQNLWKTMRWGREQYPNSKDKNLFLPEPFRSKSFVRPLHQLGLIPVVKGGVDFVPLAIGAVASNRYGKELCVLSSKTSKFMKRLVMAWGVVCEVLNQEPSRFRHSWQQFGMRYITKVAILPSHVGAPGIGWDFGSGLVINNPKWSVAYRGELYDPELPVEQLVSYIDSDGTSDKNVAKKDEWYYISCEKEVTLGEIVGWVNCSGYPVLIKADTEGILSCIRWRLDCRYQHLYQTNLIVEVCIIERSTEWKARSGAFKAMMLKRDPRTIVQRHNAEVVFLKDTIKTFDSAVDLLEICAETFSRMPEGSKYRQALRAANQLIGIDQDDCLIFDAEVAVSGGYQQLLELLNDWKQIVTTRELISEDTAEFIRRLLNLHCDYGAWQTDGDRWWLNELEIKLSREDDGLFLYQTGLGYLSTPEKPLYMGQKAEHVPVCECVSVGNVLPNALLDLGEENGSALFKRYAPEAVEYCNAMLTCVDGLPAAGSRAVLHRSDIEGLSPSEIFELASKSGDYYLVGDREYPIRLIERWLGGYDYSCEYTLARVLGDYMVADVFDQSKARSVNLNKLAQSAERLLRAVSDINRLRKVVTCAVSALNCKTVAAPEIPLDEVWVEYSLHPKSVYQQMKRAFGHIPDVLGVYRSPMISSAFYRVVVKHKPIGKHVLHMSYLACYYDQGDHDGDGRTCFDASGLSVQLASLDDLLNTVKRSLGIDLLSKAGLETSSKDLFLDHFEWLTDEQVNNKRGIKQKNHLTHEELIRFNERSYAMYVEGVAICYNLCNYPLIVHRLCRNTDRGVIDWIKDIPLDHYYGAQTLYEKVLGGWSPHLERILDWLENGGEMPVEDLRAEGFQPEYAKSWQVFYKLSELGNSLDRGLPVQKPKDKFTSDLLETAWVAFQLFRSGKTPKNTQIKLDLDQINNLTSYMLKQAYSIGSVQNVRPNTTNSTNKDLTEIINEAAAGLNEDQKKLLDLVLQKGLSVDLNGRAGTGKTYAVKRLIEAAWKLGYRVLVAAPTGQAALIYREYGGTTCARLFGYHTNAANTTIGDSNFQRLAANLRSKVAGKVLIIIDEKSMISSSELRLIYELVKTARNDKPCQWVLAGDYGQFPPVEGDYAFKSCTRHGVEYPPVVDEMNLTVLNLSQVMRQKDPLFQEALDWAYWGIAIHPAIKQRLQPAPEFADKYYYNNNNVVSENERYIAEFLAQHPNAETRIYKADMTNIDNSDLRLLMPVVPEMQIAVGMTFTVTKNISNNGVMLVANGEQVTVEALYTNSIRVRKANGRDLILDRVSHDLLDGKDKSFVQLPGYVGPALSLYKCQGKTLDRPSCFELWQEFKGRRTSLRLANTLYVAASRVTKLEYLYIGGDLKLLNGCFGANPDVVNYLLDGRRPLWVTDPAKASYVIKLLGKEDDWYLFREFSIQNGNQKDLRVLCSDLDVTYAEVLTDEGWLEIDPTSLDEDFMYLIKVYLEDWAVKE